MKKYIYCIAFITLAACGNADNESNTSGADTSTAKASHEGSHTDSSGVASNKSMMQLMQSNMDQMKAVQSTGNPDNDFAALMKVHHMGALEMSQVEVSQGTNAEIKQMAEKMIGDQQKEIAELNSFLSEHEAHGGGDSFYKEVMSKMNEMKMDMDHSGSIDKQFVQMMIPHHQGAIDMAKAYLNAGAHEPKLKTMANNIIVAQQKEIVELQAWLNKQK